MALFSISKAGIEFSGDARRRRAQEAEAESYRLAQQRSSALLKPLLNQYGPDAAKAIGSAWQAGGPAAEAATAQLGMAQQQQQAKLPIEQRVAGMPLQDQARLQSEMALAEQRQASTAVDRQRLSQAQAEGPLSLQALRSLIGQRDAASAASAANREAADSGRISQVQGRLNDRFLTQMAAPVQVADAVQQIDAGLGTGDALGSLAAVIKLAKILDPESVVREGETTTVQGGMGTAASILNAFNKAKGEGFSPASAAAFQRVVRGVAKPVLQRGLRIEDEVRAAAGTLEADPQLAVSGIGWPSDYVKRWVGGVPNPGATADLEL